MTIIKTAARLEGISEYYFASKLREIAQMRASGHQVINLGIGSPDQPPAAAVTAVLSSAAASSTAHGYQSYTGIPSLRVAWVDWYQRHYQVTLSSSDQVLPLTTIAGDVLVEYCTPFTTTVRASPAPTVAVPVIVGVVEEVLSDVTVTGPAGLDAITVAR